MNTQTKETKKESMLSKMFRIPTSKLWVYPLFFGTLLRFWGIASSSIWHDEGYTMWLLQYNPLEIIERTARDVHPPGYYLLAKPWVMLLGNSAFSIRLLSVLFSIGIIYLAYKIIERLFSERAAFWAATLVAFSPFMVRFAQEARMYGIVAFFTTLATYFLVKFIQDKNNKTLILYALAMIAAIYTQYYAFFVLIVHWIIVASVTPEFFKLKWPGPIKKRLGIFNPYWWFSGIIIIAAYLPWFPVAYRQVTRVGGSYWIKPEWITIRTIPNNISQFILYTHLDGDIYGEFYGKLLFWLAALMFVGASCILLYKKDIRNRISLLLLYGYLPMVLVFILSKIKTPVYQDRYFPFSAVGILALWGIGISIIKNKNARMTVGGIVVVLLIFGNLNMHVSTNHQMKALSETVKKEMRPGDIVLSGELYTFLDGTYYFGDGNIRLISDPVDGYGETSLFYDQQKDYVVSESQALALGLANRIFIIGKTGNKKYFSSCLLGNKKSRVIFEENKENGLKAVIYRK